MTAAKAAKAEPDFTTKTPSHQEADSESPTADRQPQTASASPLTPDIETAKDAETAKAKAGT